MINKKRLVAALAAICIAFGITDLNLNDLAFDENKAAYILLSLGLTLGLMSFWSRIKS